MHHKVKGFEAQFEVFQKITGAWAVLDRPETDFSDIDRLLGAAVRYKHPVYLELPRDQMQARQVAREPGGIMRVAGDQIEVVTLRPRNPGLMKSGPEWRHSMFTIRRFRLRDSLVMAAAGTHPPCPTDGGGRGAEEYEQENE